MDALVTLKLTVQELYTIRNALSHHEETCFEMAKESTGQAKHDLNIEGNATANLLAKLK